MHIARGVLWRSPIGPHARALLIALLVGAPCASAQDGRTQAVRPDELVPIEFTLRRVGSTEVQSILRGDAAYLPFRQIFTFLRIRNDYDSLRGVFTGFLVSRDTAYRVELATGTAVVGRRTESFSSAEFIAYQNDVYFVPEFYKRVFGLPVEYQKRRVAARLATSLQLPFYAERRLDRMERRITMRERYEDPEARFDRQYALIDGFRLDWNVAQSLRPTRVPLRTLSTQVGLHVLGGDLISRFNFRALHDVELRDSRHLWRFVMSENPNLRQIAVGDFVSSGLYLREMYGIELTNVPAYARYNFAEERLAGAGLPDRKAYIFSGGQMTGVVRERADAGFAAEVPIRYGANLVDFRSYDYWGELTEDSYRVLVPIGLVPPGEIDNTLKVGRLRDRSHPWYGGASSLWGVSSRVTLGGRAEFFDIDYLPRKIYPSMIGAVRVTPHIVGEATASPAAYYRGLVAMEFPWLLNISTSFTKYGDVRLFNPRGADYDFDFATSVPFWLGGLRSGFAGNYTQSVLPTSRERVMRLALESSMGIFSPRVSHFSGWSHAYAENLTRAIIRQTEVAARFRLPSDLFLNISSRYNHLASQFENLRIFVSLSPLPMARVNFSWDRSFPLQSSILRLDLRYIFPFMQVNLSAVKSPGGEAYGQRASGFIGYSPAMNDFFFHHRPRTAFGSFILRPFVDNNGNGVWDEGEEMVRSARLLATSDLYAPLGNLRRVNDTGWGTLTAPQYREFYVHVGENAFDDPQWIPQHRSFTLVAEPVRYPIHDIPLRTGGSVRGRVMNEGLTDGTAGPPVEGAKVRLRALFPPPGTLPFEATAITFSNGEFEFFAVPPGEYDVSLDVRTLTIGGLTAGETRKRITVDTRPAAAPPAEVLFLVNAMQ